MGFVQVENTKDVPTVLLSYFSRNGAWHTDITKLCKDSQVKFLRLIGYQIYFLKCGALLAH